MRAVSPAFCTGERYRGALGSGLTKKAAGKEWPWGALREGRLRAIDQPSGLPLPSWKEKHVT